MFFLDNCEMIHGGISMDDLISYKLLKGVEEVLKRSNSSHREETCYVEDLFLFLIDIVSIRNVKSRTYYLYAKYL